MWWDPWRDHLAKWAQWDYVFKVTAFAADFVTVVALFVAVVLAIIPIAADRRRRAQERQEQARTLRWVLQMEMESLAHAGKRTIEWYDLSHPDVFAEMKDWSAERISEYRRSFVWSPVSGTVVESALREPQLLSLGYSELTNLASLRVLILNFNAFVNAKIAIVAARASNPSESANHTADAMNVQLRYMLKTIQGLAEVIKEWNSAKLEPLPTLEIPELIPLPLPPAASEKESD